MKEYELMRMYIFTVPELILTYKLSKHQQNYFYYLYQQQIRLFLYHIT